MEHGWVDWDVMSIIVAKAWCDRCLVDVPFLAREIRFEEPRQPKGLLGVDRSESRRSAKIRIGRADVRLIAARSDQQGV
jgi:hypothetical protein